MRILLTGATGFFGQAVLRALRAQNHEIRCTVRTGTARRLPDAETLQIIETDDLFVKSADWWAETCVDIDLVIHAAWYTEPGKYLTANINLNCLTGTIAMAQGAATAKVRRFIGVGTCFEYDLSEGHLSTSTPLAPTTIYAATKASCYLTLQNYLPANNVEFLWGRLFYLYGQGENQNRLVPYIHQQMQAGEPAKMTSGQQIRDYMDVDDAAALLFSDALSDLQGATNICTGQGRTVAEIATEIADIYARRDLLAFGARPDNLTDPPVVVGVRN